MEFFRVSILKINYDNEFKLLRYRNRNHGYDAYCTYDFPVGTHHQVIKRYFWKTFKLDIDKLDTEVYKVQTLTPDETMYDRLVQEKKRIEYDLQVYSERLKSVNRKI